MRIWTEFLNYCHLKGILTNVTCSHKINHSTFLYSYFNSAKYQKQNVCNAEVKYGDLGI